MMPGDPVSALLAKSQGRITTDAAAIRALFGLDSEPACGSSTSTTGGSC